VSHTILDRPSLPPCVVKHLATMNYTQLSPVYNWFYPKGVKTQKQVDRIH